MPLKELVNQTKTFYLKVLQLNIQYLFFRHYKAEVTGHIECEEKILKTILRTILRMKQIFGGDLSRKK